MRRRFKQECSLRDRLAAQAKAAREQARRLPPGKERESLLRKARQSETASHIDEWLSSPGLRAPRNSHGGYRAYFVGLDGHIVGFEPMVCANDEVKRAGRLPEGCRVELWSGTRPVIRLPDETGANERFWHPPSYLDGGGHEPEHRSP
jgi:hypothetical protein